MSKVFGLTKSDVSVEVGKALSLRKDVRLPIDWTIADMVTVFWTVLSYIDPVTLWRSSNAYPYLGISGGQHALKGLISPKAEDREKNAATWKVLSSPDCLATWNDRVPPEMENLLKKASPESWRVISKKRGYAIMGEVYFLSLGRHLSYSKDGRLKTSGHMVVTPEASKLMSLVAGGQLRRTTELESSIVTAGNISSKSLLSISFNDTELASLLGLDSLDTDAKALASATKRKGGRKSKKTA